MVKKADGKKERVIWGLVTLTAELAARIERISRRAKLPAYEVMRLMVESFLRVIEFHDQEAVRLRRRLGIRKIVLGREARVAMHYCDPPAGTIRGATEEAVKMAQEKNESVILDINDLYILVEPENSSEDIEKLYHEVNAIRNKEEAAALEKKSHH